MSKKSKALEKICKSPTPASVKWEELRTALEGLGYTVLNGSGSRRKFFHTETKDIISCHEPHPSPDVDKGCLDAVITHLREQGLVK